MVRAMGGADGVPIDDNSVGGEHAEEGNAEEGNAEEENAERALVRALIRSPRSDGDTLDPFAARRDKRYVFAAERGAVLAYRPLFGVALGSGDPVGVVDQFPDCVGRFVRRCEELRLRPVVMLARQDRLPLYERLGFKAFYLGDEAVLDVDGFTLDTPRMRNVRQAVKRSVNFGVATQVLWETDVPPSLVASLRAVTVVARRGRREEGFSAALEEPFTVPQPECLVVVSRDRTGAVVGFQRYSPCHGGAKLSVDAMRRLPGAPNGVAERMIHDVVEWARDHGVVEVSLNFVAFRRQLQALDVATGKALTPRALRRLNPAGAPTLYSFTEKFRPRWVPRYLAYRSITDIPGFAVATLSAESRLPPWVARVGSRARA